HGVIRGIDTAAARAMPGVLALYTGADLAAASYGTLKCIVPFKNRDGSEMKKPPRPALPTDKVRYVGDPVACVVAETLLQAKDAAEAVELDIEPLQAVTDPEEAVREGAPAIYAEAPGNVALDYHYGDSDAVTAAFAQAAHITRLKLVNNRIVVNAMEPRAALALYEDGRFTLHVPSQGVFGMKGSVAQVLGVEPKQVRVVTGNVGGSFGMKAPVFSEYVCALHEVSTKCVFTNTSQVSAYRGAGRPEGNYYMERLIDAAAAKLGIDRLELRRRNHIRARELPAKTASGMTYDSGHFATVMKKA